MQRSTLKAGAVIAGLLVAAVLGVPGVRSVPCVAGEEPKGDIDWVRDMDAAVKQSKDTGKPLIAYFTFDT